MKKLKARKVKLTGDQFVILTARAQSRLGVEKLSKSLVGSASTTPNFVLTYFRPEQFPSYLAKRFLISTRLARLAHYYVFLFRPTQRLHVAGACAQYGTGSAGSIQRDAEGRVVYSGIDAAHIRLGSYYINSQSVLEEWRDQLHELVQSAGNGATVPSLLPANGVLLHLLSTYEAATDMTDTLMNRVFGQLESAIHPAMRNLLLQEVPEDIEAFGAALARFSDGFPRLLAMVLKRRAQDRLNEITLDPTKEQLQSPDGPRMFASEGQMLRAIIDQAERGSQMSRDIDHSQALAWRDIEDELNDVRLAQEELSDLLDE